MREGYSVTVLKWGEPILTIEHSMISGKSTLTQEDEDAIRDGGRHLTSFAGTGEPQPCFACGSTAECEDYCPQ